MEIVLDMDRLDCIAREFIRICETNQFVSVRLELTDKELHITPLAEQIKIVLTK